MAITIIKRGNSPQAKLYNTICLTCSCEFTFLRKDAEREEFDCSSHDYMFVICPECSHYVKVVI